MDPILTGILSFVFLMMALMAGIPIAVGMASIGIVGFYLIGGFDATLTMVSLIPWAKATHYTFTVVPLFILMGSLIYYAGFGRDLYEAARKWVGHLPGGLSATTILACTGFAAACGSSTATAATMGKIAVPEMDRSGYDRRLSLGSVASGGTIAIMIPPSIAMILLCSVTDQPISKMLIAGIFPGLLMALSYITMVIIRAWRNPRFAPRGPRFTWRQRFSSLGSIWAVAVISLIVLGGLYFGFFTPTESGGIGSLGALILGVATKRLDWQAFVSALLDTVRTMGMIFLIVIAAFMFSTQFTISRLPQELANWVLGMNLSPIMVLLWILMLYLVMGTFVETIPLIFLVVPIVFPMTLALGINPLWFGILTIHCIEMGMITPPFGITLFATKASMPDARLDDIIKGMIPFLCCDAIVAVMLIVFPKISLFLPSLMKG